MNPPYLSPFANHLWQSTVFAAVAGLLTLVLRRNSARVRHSVWLAASCKFLLPLSLLIVLGERIPWRTAPELMPSNFSVAMDEMGQHFSAPAASLSLPATVHSPASPIPAVLWGLWAFGFLGIAGSWWVRWRRILATVRRARSVQLAIPISARSSPTLLEPGIFGVFRPVLLLPEGIFERLTPTQLQAVIAHELCHFRYRDNLTATIQMIVETIFWFHPLVWWIGKRMVWERERACDEEVLRLGSQPQVYAEGILNICKLYMESPLVCVSGVTGANLKRRIEAIMTERLVLRMNFAKRAMLGAAAVAAIALPIAIGIIHAPIIRAQSQEAPTGRLPQGARWHLKLPPSSWTTVNFGLLTFLWTTEMLLPQATTSPPIFLSSFTSNSRTRCGSAGNNGRPCRPMPICPNGSAPTGMPSRRRP
jgi:bla regulator protein blaR1